MTEHIWAPWRMEYIKSEKEKECLFCRVLKQGPDAYRSNLLLIEQKHAFVMLNRYPYTSGAVMVVPKTHVSDFMDLDRDEYSALWLLVRRSVRALQDAVNPQGVNIGVNLGEPAGAGIKEHVHVHLVPRWVGDTNFMSCIADLRVMPEYLYETLDTLMPHFEKIVEQEKE